MAKQVIVMRNDLKDYKGKKVKIGKLVAQGAHSSLAVILNMMNNGQGLKDTEPDIKDGKYTISLDVEVGSPLDNWLRGIFKKVCVEVNSEEELLDIYEKAKNKNLPTVLIEDAGLTMFHGVHTNTCIAIGPANEEDIDEITGHLKLL